MPVVAERDFVPSPDSIVIHGRPDLRDGDSNDGYSLERTISKRHHPYVFSQRGGQLLHRVLRVEIEWWVIAGGGHCLVRVTNPRMLARTLCGSFFWLKPGKARTCEAPADQAVLCGRCNGEPATFGSRGSAKRTGMTRQRARTLVGCSEHSYQPTAPREEPQP